MKKKMIYVMLIACLGFMFACDDTPDLADNSENIEGGSTVYLVAATDDWYYEADIYDEYDSDNDGICESASVLPDDIAVTITSTPYDSLNELMTASGVIIERAVIKFNPVPDSDYENPVVPSKTLNMGVPIEAGGSVGFSVRIIDREDKIESSHPFSSLYDTEYEYTVDIIFTAVEVSSGISFEFTAPFTLRYTNLAESGC